MPPGSLNCLYKRPSLYDLELRATWKNTRDIMYSKHGASKEDSSNAIKRCSLQLFNWLSLSWCSEENKHGLILFSNIAVVILAKLRSSTAWVMNIL